MNESIKLVNFALQLGINENTADLIVSETMGEVVEMYEQGRIEQTGVMAWCYNTVRNRCYDHLRMEGEQQSV